MNSVRLDGDFEQSLNQIISCTLEQIVTKYDFRVTGQVILSYVQLS